METPKEEMLRIKEIAVERRKQLMALHLCPDDYVFRMCYSDYMLFSNEFGEASHICGFEILVVDDKDAHNSISKRKL